MLNFNFSLFLCIFVFVFFIVYAVDASSDYTEQQAASATAHHIKSCTAFESNPNMLPNKYHRLYPRFTGPRQKYNQMVGRNLEPARPHLVKLCLQGLKSAKRSIIKKVPELLKLILIDVLNVTSRSKASNKPKKENKVKEAFRRQKSKLKEAFSSIREHKDSEGEQPETSDQSEIALPNTIGGSSIKSGSSRKESLQSADKASTVMQSTIYPILITVISKSINLFLGRLQEDTTQSIADNAAELILYRIYLKLSWSPQTAVPNAVVVTNLDSGPEARRLEQLRAAMRSGTAVAVDIERRSEPGPSIPLSDLNTHDQQTTVPDQTRAAAPVSGIRGAIRKIVDKALDKLMNWLYKDIDIIIDGTFRASVEDILRTVHSGVMDITEDHLTFCERIIRPSYTLKWTKQMIGMGFKIMSWPGEKVLDWWESYRKLATDSTAATSIAKEQVDSAYTCSQVNSWMGTISTNLQSSMSYQLNKVLDGIIADVQRKARKSSRRFFERKIHVFIPVFPERFSG
ncbi:hypothetical protein BDF19DRAFT_477783 [Syncephalis fuscata]|nr:hypothetical protein BDF19DRAFT_477783 [Syncephalis fuscata]